MANDATRAWALGVPHPKKGWGWRQPGFSESNDFAFKGDLFAAVGLHW